MSPDKPSAGTRPGSSRPGRRRLLTFAAVAVTAVAVITGMHAASAAVCKPAVEMPQPAAPSFDPATEEALWRRQELLSGLGAWIDAQPGITTSGYVTSIDDPDAGSTILVWHGPPDDMQRQIVDEARRRHIPVSIQQRKYSMDDLERAVTQLNAIDSGTGVFQNFTVSAVGSLAIDFDGVTVLGDYIHPPVEGISAADTALAQALAARTGVAVRIEHGRLEPV